MDALSVLFPEIVCAVAGLFFICFGLELAAASGMSEAACRSGDAKLKTEAQRDCVFHDPSATSARYRAV